MSTFELLSAVAGSTGPIFASVAWRHKLITALRALTINRQLADHQLCFPDLVVLNIKYGYDKPTGPGISLAYKCKHDVGPYDISHYSYDDTVNFDSELISSVRRVVLLRPPDGNIWAIQLRPDKFPGGWVCTPDGMYTGTDVVWLIYQCASVELVFQDHGSSDSLMLDVLANLSHNLLGALVWHFTALGKFQQSSTSPAVRMETIGQLSHIVG